jgi:hypothetical protein
MENNYQQDDYKKGYSYGKRSLWQWILIYIVVGGIIYAGTYYFFFAKSGGYNYNPNQYQGSQQYPNNY